MQTIEYTPIGVCSRKILIQVEDGVIIGVTFEGGCPGNLLGISALVKNQPINDVIKKLSGIRCGNKPTSCPDQLAKALSFIENAD